MEVTYLYYSLRIQYNYLKKKTELKLDGSNINVMNGMTAAIPITSKKDRIINNITIRPNFFFPDVSNKDQVV